MQTAKWLPLLRAESSSSSESSFFYCEVFTMPQICMLCFSLPCTHFVTHPSLWPAATGKCALTCWPPSRKPPTMPSSRWSTGELHPTCRLEVSFWTLNVKKARILVEFLTWTCWFLGLDHIKLVALSSDIAVTDVILTLRQLLTLFNHQFQHLVHCDPDPEQQVLSTVALSIIPSHTLYRLMTSLLLCNCRHCVCIQCKSPL